MDVGGGERTRAGAAERGSAAVHAHSAHAAPTLPAADPGAGPAVADHRAPPAAPVVNRYRSDQQRARRLYRRANPLYRRIARGLIGLSILTFVAIAAFVGWRQVDEYLGRDRLPSIGSEVAEFRSTSFLIRSGAPSPALSGTLTIDSVTGAFQFVGSTSATVPEQTIASPDGETVFVRGADGAWAPAMAGDDTVATVKAVIPFLVGMTGADVVLTSQLRSEIELLDKTVTGAGDDSRSSYSMVADLTQFRTRNALLWIEYTEQVAPGATEGRQVPLTITVDDDNVLVRFVDQAANWRWERLSRSDQPFVPIEP